MLNVRRLQKGLAELLIILLLCIGEKVIAQNSPPDVFDNLGVASPTTASFTRFTDIPVSLYTGTPGISVPLYEISTSFVKVPIGLSYQGSGIRVSENASNIGLGWTLNAGGVISRTVYGLPDNGTWQINGMKWTSRFNITDTAHYLAASGLFQGSIDGVPDLYMYNFPGYSGRFIIADQIRQLPVTNLKISQVGNSEFRIVPEDGNTYVFSAEETSRNKTATSVNACVVGWYLTKIVAADKLDSVQFIYENTFYEEETGQSYVREFYQTFSGQWNGVGTASSSSFVNTIKGKQLTRILFKQGSVDFNISWNTREDMYAADAPAIPLIKGMFVRDKSGNILKTINFQYDYFTNNVNNVDNKRLKLTGVNLNGTDDADTSKAQRYRFTYNNIRLPAKSSLSQDHWGYFNNANNTTTLIPSYSGGCVDDMRPGVCVACSDMTTVLRFNGADRETNGSFVTAGMLEKVTYPTGGFTTFEWEPHDIPNQDTPTTVYRSVGVADAQARPTSNSFVIDSSSDFYVDPALYPQGLCANVRYGFGIGSWAAGDAAAINHAGGSVILYKRAGGRIMGHWNLFYSGLYNGSENVTLEPGASYYVVSTIRGEGFSAVIYLNAQVPSTGNFVVNKVIGGCRLKRMTFHDPVAKKDMVTSYIYRLPSDTAVSSGVLYRDPVYVQNVKRFEKNSALLCDYILEVGVRLSSNSIIPLGTGSHIGYAYVKEIKGERAEGGYNLYQYASGIMSEGPFRASWRSGYLRSKSTFTAKNELAARENYSYTIDSRGRKVFEGNTIDFFTAHPCAPIDHYEESMPAVAVGKYWNFPSEWFHMDSVQTTIYDTETHSKPFTAGMRYMFENASHLKATKITKKNSDGTQTSTYYKYPLDYVLPGGILTSEAQALKDLQILNIHSLIETYTQKVNPSSDQPITTEAIYSQYRSIAQGAAVLLDKQYVLEGGNNYTGFTPAYVSGNGVQKDVSYAMKVAVNKYDKYNNIEEVEKQGQNRSSYIWDYDNSHLVAKVANAGRDDIAYTSFEADGKGSWVYSGSAISDGASVTGRRHYNLGSGTITRTGLKTSAEYFVSYWTKNTSPFVIGGTIVGYPLKGIKAGEWTYYLHRLTGRSSIDINGTGTIDELRLYPIEASMTTMTYDPLKGITSEANEEGNVTSYTYDNEGRLWQIKNHNGEILKQFEYAYQNPLSAKWVETANTRCQTGNGGYLTGIIEKEEKDVNQYSASYGTTRWTNGGVNIACPVVADWKATGNTRCQVGTGNYLTGKLEEEQKDLNPYSTTYNNTRWIDKGVNVSCPVLTDWKATGNTRCQTGTGGYLTGHAEREEQDMNPYSSTYNVIRWMDNGISASCVITADWQPTGAVRCIVNAWNTNTGEQEIQQRDLNPYSSTYNTTRWKNNGASVSCPLPPACEGDFVKPVNNICENGEILEFISTEELIPNKWQCTYKVKFSVGPTVLMSVFRSRACTN